MNRVKTSPAVSFSAALALSFSVIALSSCERTGSSGEEPAVLSVLTSGGSYTRGLDKAYFEPFTEETGIEVQLVAGGDNPIAAIKAQRAAGRIQFDIVNFDDFAVSVEPDEFEVHGLELPDDLLVPVLYPKTSVPVHVIASYTVACNKAMVDRCPRSYADFFDIDAFPGDRSLPSMGIYEALGMLEVALLADGVRPEDLYPIDLDRAFSKLEGIKDSVRLFWTSYSGAQDVLRSGEAPITLLQDGRARQLVIDHDLDLSISYVGAQSYNVNWLIPKGAPHADVARIFVQWTLDNPQSQAVLTSMTFYGPASAKGAKAVENMGIANHTGLHLEKTRMITLEEVEKSSRWVSENGDAMMDRWNEFVSR